MTPSTTSTPKIVKKVKKAKKDKDKDKRRQMKKHEVVLLPLAIRKIVGSPHPDGVMPFTGRPKTPKPNLQPEEDQG